MTRFERWSVLVGSLLTGVTGIAYLWVKYAMQPTDPWAVFNHPIQPWLLKSHIVVAPLLVFAVGMIAMRHVWRHYRSGMRWGRKTGIASALSFVPMVLTGYLIQGITHEGWLGAVALAHIFTSIVFVVAVAVHAVILARLLARSREALRSSASTPRTARASEPDPTLAGRAV